MVQPASKRLVTEASLDVALDAEAALARNADNLASGTVPDARIPASIARDSEVATAVGDEAALARNAVNLTSGLVNDARIPSTIARITDVDAKITAAQAAVITDGDTTHSPTSDAVFDALALKQPLDPDLTAIAGLTATTDNIIQAVGSAWASRTPTQVKTALALNNVDNTSDINKPVSTAQAAADAALIIDSIADADTTHAPSRNAVFDALALKAPLASPAFTGNPTAPTPTVGDADTSVATTAFVAAAIGAATASNALIAVVPITASGDFDKSLYTGGVSVLFFAIGGGGAGGGGVGGGAGQSQGGGGGAGGLGIKRLAFSALSTLTAIRIGAGGTGVSGAAGNAGGDTEIGPDGTELLIAKGGSGGGIMSSSQEPGVSAGGAGGVAGTGGDLNLPGNPGDSGRRLQNSANAASAGMTGYGGAAFFGGRAVGVSGSAQTGNAAAANTGSGGSGGMAVASNTAGGAGGSGLVLALVYG